MTTLESACDERRLRALLAGSPADSSEVEIERHLEQCADCRRRLTELAAAPSDWRDASDLLREAVGGEPYRAERPRGAWSLDTSQIEAICEGTEPATRHHIDAAQYTAAMVRPLLDPPSQP